jgi:hypothetical protein
MKKSWAWWVYKCHPSYGMECKQRGSQPRLAWEKGETLFKKNNQSKKGLSFKHEALSTSKKKKSQYSQKGKKNKKTTE